MNIDHVISFNQWRRHARSLLQQSIPPSQVNWSAQQQTQLPFNNDPITGNHDTRHHVPKAFMRLAKSAACYRDEGRWSLLYSVLWRLTHGSPQLLHNANDAEVKQLMHMAQAVRRDVHKMHAFVRFRLQCIDQVDWYVAWFEPSHLIVEYTADFFVKRFNSMKWSILTPDTCAHWDQQQLTLTAGTEKPQDNLTATDEMDRYWLQYYRHIFNPARLKTRAMQSEMPKKYWHNLPEAALINELIAQSGQRTQAMLNSTLSDPNRMRDKSKRLRRQQNQIRDRHDD